MVGRDTYAQFVSDFWSGFPDIHFDVQEVITQGDRVAVRWLVTGTCTGEQIFRDITPAGQQIEIVDYAHFRIEGGRVAEKWYGQDQLAFLQQLEVTDRPRRSRGTRLARKRVAAKRHLVLSRPRSNVRHVLGGRTADQLSSARWASLQPLRLFVRYAASARSPFLQHSWASAMWLRVPALIYLCFTCRQAFKPSRHRAQRRQHPVHALANHDKRSLITRVLVARIDVEKAQADMKCGLLERPRPGSGLGPQGGALLPANCAAEPLRIHQHEVTSMPGRTPLRSLSSPRNTDDRQDSAAASDLL